jgi:ABC-2 type transport system permease protein
MSGEDRNRPSAGLERSVGGGGSTHRLWNLFLKEMLETFRDWKMLSLTLTFAPFFVLLMYGYLGHTTPVYQVAVVNEDRGGLESEALLAALREVREPEGETVLRIREASSDEVDQLLQDRRADVALVIPQGFSAALAQFRANPGGSGAPPLPVRSRGDPANPDYIMAAVWADMTVMAFVEYASGIQTPLVLSPETVSGSSSLTDFELYVPGLLSLSLMMLMFTAAGALIREKDRGTIIRLRLSNLSVAEWLTAVTVTQLIVGILALALTYLTAWAVGYRAQGSLANLLAVGIVTSVSIMAFSVPVAAFLRTVFDLVTVGCFPFFILMFFSGGMFPLPGVPLFTVGSRAIEMNEILPTTHAISAMGKILNYGAGLGEVLPEISAVLGLSLVFYATGTWIFTKRHMTAAR